MKTFNFFCFLIALLWSGINLNAQSNLLIDGGFETGTQGSWIKVTNNNDDVWNDALNAYSGAKNYKWDKGSQTDVRRGQIVDVTAGSVYTITIHYKFYQTSVKVPFVACYFYPSTETFSATSNYGKAEDAVAYPNGTGKICWLPSCAAITSTNSDYETFTTNVTAPAGVDKMFFEMYWGQTKVYLDDISIASSSISTGLDNNKTDVFVFVNNRKLEFNHQINSVEVYNSIGSLISKGNNINQLQLKSTGIFFVKMFTSVGVMTQKVIVK